MEELVKGCGVAVLRGNNEVLLGLRSDGQGWSLAGGKIEEGETSMQAAKRELKEEFNIDAKKLNPFAYIVSHSFVYGKKCKVSSYIYTCTDFTGEPFVNEEMLDFKWVNVNEARSSLQLFPPTQVSLDRLSSFTDAWKGVSLVESLDSPV